MENKRQEARSAAKAQRAAAEAHATAQARARAEATEQARDVMAGLRELGVRADQARRAVEFSETLQKVTPEERMRAALKFLCHKSRFQGRVGTSVGASP